MRNANWRYFDFWLFGAVAVLTIFGVAMINSTIAGNIDMATASRRQFVFAILGVIALFGVAYIDYHLWQSINRPIYVVTVVVLAILLIAGKTILGSARWFKTTLVSIQPSEFAKIVIILVLAEYFTVYKNQIGSLGVVARSLIMTVLIVVWIIFQPNLSTSIVILVLWFALLWASGLKIKHLVFFATGSIILPIVGFPLLADYQQNRILKYLRPEPTASYGDTYNIQQALISIGSGGLFGKGYGLGTQVQLRFLKVRWSDYIFSAMAEEFGFVGTVIVLLLLLFVIYRVLRAARLSRDTFGALICYGVATLLAFQGMVNVGVNLRLIPATGLPLPFISYGGSSLFSLFIGIGLVESVILRHKSLEFSKKSQ